MKTIFTLLLLLFFLTGIAQDKIYVHTATSENTIGNITYMDITSINGNPNKGIVFVHAWNPNGLPAVYNNKVSGLWYDSIEGLWAIYNEDESPMIIGSHYMVYIANDPDTVITHVANSGNMGSFGNITTVIDHPLMNNMNSGPWAVMCHYFNPNGVYNNQNFGFYYDVAKDKRGMYDENGNPAIEEGTAFKVLISGEGVNSFSHRSTAENSSSNWTRIDDPLLNGNPNATFVFAHYWGAQGASTEVDIDAVTSAYYDGSHWAIYNEDTSIPMPENVFFDIIVAPEILGMAENELQPSISMFPNPATNGVNFTALDNIQNIGILNLVGQEILSVEFNKSEVEIDISSLSVGTYFARVKTANGSQTLKLIKE